MDIKELQYFKTVCEQKSITQAAYSLYMTPQGLSKVMKNMEAELGATLLIRSGSGVTLTESGKYLYEHLTDLLESYQTICNEIRCIEQRENHEIDLLSAYGILRLVTPECIAKFREEYPHIKFQYREYPDHEVERRFLAGEGNVAFTVGAQEVKYLKSTFMERFPIHDVIREKCKRAGFEPNIVFETSGFSLCHKMVSKKRGLSVTVDFIFDDMRDNNLVMIPFSDGEYCWDTYMLTRKGNGKNPDIQIFHDHVMKWIEKVQKHPEFR